MKSLRAALPAGCHGSATDDASEGQFRALGFTVLTGAVDGTSLRAEVERTLFESRARPHTTELTRFSFVPMMTARTPQSLALLDALEITAERLLGAAVVPVRAKGVRYSGTTGWHRDSTRRVPSVGFLAYLDPLTAETGALRVVPGSHRLEAVDDLSAERALATSPGDVIVMDERLLHASSGGAERLQWRVDFVQAPESATETDEVRALFASVFTSDWDGGYDPELAPSYDSAWRASGRRSVERLAALGVYEMAHAQEAAMRARRLAAT